MDPELLARLLGIAARQDATRVASPGHPPTQSRATASVGPDTRPFLQRLLEHRSVRDQPLLRLGRQLGVIPESGGQALAMAAAGPAGRLVGKLRIIRNPFSSSSDDAWKVVSRDTGEDVVELGTFKSSDDARQAARKLQEGSGVPRQFPSRVRTVSSEPGHKVFDVGGVQYQVDNLGSSRNPRWVVREPGVFFGRHPTRPDELVIQRNLPGRLERAERQIPFDPTSDFNQLEGMMEFRSLAEVRRALREIAESS